MFTKLINTMSRHSSPHNEVGQKNMRKSGEKRLAAGEALGNQDMIARGNSQISNARHIQPRLPQHKRRENDPIRRN